MSSNYPIRVGIVGLGFGAEFIPIYQAHPQAELAGICQRNPERLNAIGDAFAVSNRYTDYAEMLGNSEIDAIHINTPIPNHAELSIAALRAGKHVACTVPMATSVDDCQQIVELTEKTGLSYMMMETVVYSREFLFMKQLFDQGELGDLQFIQASHQQDMDGWPEYWPGLPPMHYATHCVGPCLALTQQDAKTVSCFGSGKVREELKEVYGSPFAIETAHIALADGTTTARICRSLFDTARQYRESIDVYGSKKSVEWPLIEGDPLVVHTAKKPEAEIPELVRCPDFSQLLPEAIRSFTTKGVYDLEGNDHLSFAQGGGHGGSHPHLVHEFVSALGDGRPPYPNARQSANWTCVGLLAHQSAMRQGQLMQLPDFTQSP